MPLTFLDFIEIVETTLVLFVSGFALLLPLHAYFKNLKLALKLCIPISLAIEILIGYIFYITEQIKIFPITYLILILLINLILAYRAKLFRQIKNIRFTFNWKKSLPAFLVIISVIFSRFYDALYNIAPGAIDAAAHAQYVLDIDLYGRLSCTYYAPGFHILIYPLSKMIEMANVYRFAGPVMGIIMLLSLFLLFKDFFKNKLSLYFLVLAFGLPVFNILTAQTISFFPTALTFVFLPMLVYILIKPTELPPRKILIFYIITVAALALSVPYLLVQFIPSIILLNFIALVAVKTLGKKYLVPLSKMSAILILGFILAFGHVYLQSQISKANNTHSFPQIIIAEDQDSGIIGSSNLDKTSSFLSRHKWLPEKIRENTIVKSYLVPMIMTGSDVMKVKGVRPLGSAVSIFAYLWIIISIAMVYFGIRKKNMVLLVLGTLVLVFGISTQTGILEMSTYQGRSGWYLLLFVLISSIYLLDMVIKKIPRVVLYVLLGLMFIASFISPPRFYRGYFTEYFTQAKAITHRFPNQRILFVSDWWRVSVVSKNSTYEPFEPNSVTNICDFDQCFVVFSNKFFEIDPILSQATLSSANSLETFKNQQVAQKQAHDQAVKDVKNSNYFSSYRLYWENENISIYQFIK
jgi:hypothetical protein